MSQNNEMNGSKRSILLGVSYERFYFAMPYIMEALEVMNETYADINQLDKCIRRGGAQKINKKLPRIYMRCPISVS